MNVAGNEQIKAAVAIVIAKAGACGPVAESNARALGDVSKRAVVVIAVEAVFAEVCHVEIRPAVVIKVAHGHAKTPAVVGYARLAQPHW